MPPLTVSLAWRNGYYVAWATPFPLLRYCLLALQNRTYGVSGVWQTPPLNGFFGMATRKLCCMSNAVPSAPSLSIGFAKQNLWGIGRMVNATLNGFAGVVKQYLRLVKTQHSQSPCTQKTVGISQLSLHNCPFIFSVLPFCASLFPFYSLLFNFLLFYFFTFLLPPFSFFIFSLFYL